MASWEDGPEYAPRERPDGFDAPDVPPLPDPPASAEPAAEAPATPPDAFEPAREPQPALASIAVAERNPRDPEKPFGVARAIVTASGTTAWGATHAAVLSTPGSAAGTGSAFDPRQPFRVESRSAAVAQPQPSSAPTQFAPPVGPPAFPAPGTPAWFGPSRPVGVPRGPARVTARDWLTAVSPVVLICFGLGLLLTFFVAAAPVAYLAGFMATFLIRYRPGPIRITGVLLIGFQLFCAFVSLTLDGADLGGMWETWNLLAWASCLVELLVASVMVWLALRNRERPLGRRRP